MTSFYVPGKTFLVGEYAVLLDGPALGLATAPQFEINYQKIGTAEVFHPESPAGLYLNSVNRTVQASVSNPYLTGGFGRSTAEYFAAILPDVVAQKKTFAEILKTYRDLHSQKSVPPSGIDLAIQFYGRVCHVDQKKRSYASAGWNFKNLDFFILATGFKYATHEHLKTLNLNLLQGLPELAQQVIEDYMAGDEERFLETLREWKQELLARELTLEKSAGLMDKLESFEKIRLVKACGALGADVLLVFFDRENKSVVRQFLQDGGFNIQSGSADLVEGLETQLGRAHVD